MRRPRARILAIGGIVLAGALALYLVGMNVFLRTRLFRDAIGFDPGSLLVDYASAYSLFPGHIHVEGLSIRGRDSHVEWILRLDRCDFRIAFVALLHRQFHASHVDGDGLSLRVRLRKAVVTPAEMADLPPVPGFADPPLAEPGPPPPPLSDADYKLWSVLLEGVDARHVRELWIDRLRYAGDLEIRGRWLFRPLRWLDVGPATLDLHPLDVSFGTAGPWLSRASGNLVVTVGPFDLRAVGGTAIIDQVSVDGVLGGVLRASNALGREAIGTLRADAPFDAHLRLDRGVLRPGTEVRSRTFEALAFAGGLAFDASCGVEGHVDADGGHVTLTASGLRASEHGVTRARATTIFAGVASRDLDLAHGLANASFAVDLRDASTDALPYWRSRLPIGAPIALNAGSATASGHLDGLLGARTAEGHATLDATGLRANIGGAELAGAVRVVAQLRRSGSATDLSGSSVAFTGDAGAKAVDWWGAVDATHALLTMNEGPRHDAPRLQVDLVAHAKDAGPLAAIVAKGTPVPAVVVNAISTKGFEASGQVIAGPDALAARSVVAHGAGIDAAFEYAEGHAQVQWALLVDLGLIKLGIHSAGGKTDLALFGTRPWFDEQAAVVRASVRP